MNRKSFLKRCVALGSLSMVPSALHADHETNKREDKGFKVEAGKDRFDASISLYEGDTFSSKVSTKDTGGDLYLYESSRVKQGGPPFHYHFAQDE